MILYKIYLYFLVSIIFWEIKGVSYFYKMRCLVWFFLFVLIYYLIWFKVILEGGYLREIEMKELGIG